VRASDLYIATVKGHVRLVGVDVSFRSILRRLGPKRLRTRPTPELVIDWATIQSFGGQETTQQNLKLGAHRKELRKLRPGELADLLEDLGRDERQEILSALPKEEAADILEEMEPKEVETVLRESTKQEAGIFLSNMEPDEAADALRDIDENLRKELLEQMTIDSAARVRKVLSYDEAAAGGFMNTALFRADASESVARVRTRLLAGTTDLKEIESVVIEDGGKFVYDLSLIDLLIADTHKKISNLITPPETVTVAPDATIGKVAALLVESRRSSILVVDEGQKALGRIFADDIVDALLPEIGFFHFPRLLS
jgi:Mg/Co/Ni transporter MgtE